MTQPLHPSALGLDDAYLYGAWVDDMRLDGWDLLVAVRYSDRVSEFFELEPRLNVLACTLVFQTVRNRAAVEAFRQRWEASDQAWSLASVAADPSGGFGLATREGGELIVDCEVCVLGDVTPFEIDGRRALRLPVAQSGDAVHRFAAWQRNQYTEPLYAQGGLPRFAALFLGGNAALGFGLWLLGTTGLLSFQLLIGLGLAAVLLWFGAMLVWAIRILRPKTPQ